MQQTEQLFSSFFGPSTLVALLRHRAKMQLNDLAFGYLKDGDTDMIRMSNGDLDRQARRIGAWLQKRGMAGQKALLLYPPGLDFIAAFFGCLYAGVVAVPVYPPRKNRSVNRVQIIAQDCDAKVALTNTDALSRIAGPLEDAPRLRSLLWLDTTEIEVGTEDDWQDPDVDGSTLAFLQYTSGSTGAPKGVMLNHANLMHNSALIAHAFENTRSGVGVFWLPTYHDMGLIGGILQPLYVGCPNIIMSPMSFLTHPFRWLSAISRYRATVSGGPNFAYDLAIRKIKPEQLRQLDLSSWKVAFNGAEPVRPDTLNAFAEKFAPCGFHPEAFYPCYGLAEASLLVAGGYVPVAPTQKYFDADLLRNGWAVEVAKDAPNARAFVANGCSLPDQLVAIVNPETKELCLDGEVGEIWIHGPSVAKGYWNKPEVTKESFDAYIANFNEPAPAIPGPYFRTGDLGFQWQGEMYVSGRLKDMIIWHGVNVYPQDVELTVQDSSPLVRKDAGAVFAVEKAGRELLVVVQEVDRKPHANYAEVVDTIRRSVSAQHELPLDAVILIKHGTIPKTSSGKIQRHACRQEFIDNELTPMVSWDASDDKIVVYDPVISWESMDERVVIKDPNDSQLVSEDETAQLASSGAQVLPSAGKLTAADHTAEEIRKAIPDLDKRGKAIIFPKQPQVTVHEIPVRPAVSESAVSAKTVSDVTRSGMKPMMGAHVSSSSDVDDTVESMENWEGGFGTEDGVVAPADIERAKQLEVGIDLKDLRQSLKTLDTTGLPSDLATPEYLEKMLKIVIQQVKNVARERADGIKMDSPITEMGMDSIERMDILASLEETFGGRFPEAVLQDLITAKDVAEAICKYFGKCPRLREVLTTEGTAQSKAVMVAAETIPEEYYVFEKFPEYKQLQQTFADQLATGMCNPYFTVHEARSADTTVIGGKEYIHFSSYNYLGLGSNQEVIDFVKAATDKYGTSASASRLVSGNKDLHVQFEREVSEFIGVEDTLVFSAGHHLNENVIGHMAGKGDLVLHDALAHNSLVMGAILSGADRRPFAHSDWQMVDDILKRYRREYRRVWIVVEGVYSMDGDIAPIPEFIEIKKRHKAFLYVDEAHSMGTLGKRGAGVCDYFGIDPGEGDLWMSTISKSFASCGGFISGRKPMIEYLRYTDPAFIFSAAITPPATAAALAALRILKREPERVERLRQNAALFLRLAKEAGLDTGLSSGTPVVPIIYGNSRLSLQMAQRMFERGVNVQPILYPAVEEKATRLRFFMTAIHTPEQIEYTVKTMAEETEKAKAAMRG